MVDLQTYYLGMFQEYSGKQFDGDCRISNSPDEIVNRIVEPIKRLGCNITTNKDLVH